MYIHSSDISRILISPNDIQKVLTAVNFVRVEHQKFQHVKLFCGKIDLLACNKYTAALAVQFQISGLDRLCFFFFFMFGTCTTHDRLNTCLDFQNIEWFCDIVVCTDVESEDLVGIFGFCRQDDDRKRIALTDFYSCPDAVKPGHHDVDNKKIYHFRVQNIQCLLAVIGFQNVIAFLCEIDFDCFHDGFIVIANKYISHFFVPP